MVSLAAIPAAVLARSVDLLAALEQVVQTAPLAHLVDLPAALRVHHPSPFLSHHQPRADRLVC